MLQCTKTNILIKLYNDFTKQEKQLINTAKIHFLNLKKEKITVIPFGYTLTKLNSKQRISLRGLDQDFKLPLIDQLWQKALSSYKKEAIKCFLVAFDAHVEDETHIDKDALAILLKKEDNSKIQVNIPYVEDKGDVVFGKSWTTFI